MHKLIKHLKLDSKFSKVVLLPKEGSVEYKKLKLVFDIYIGNKVFEYGSLTTLLDSIINKNLNLDVKNLVVNKDNEVWSFIYHSYGPVQVEEIETLDMLNDFLKPIKLNDLQLLEAYIYLLKDALSFLEYDLNNFIEVYDFEGSIKNIRKGELVYERCEQTYRKLSMNECEIRNDLTIIKEQLEDKRKGLI